MLVDVYALDIFILLEFVYALLLDLVDGVSRNL